LEWELLPADWKSAIQQVGNLRYGSCDGGILFFGEAVEVFFAA
jgi:hypothetical protein